MRNIINLSLFLVAISCSNEPKTISGWELVWNDEFNRGKIDPSKWIFDIGTGAPVFEAFEPSSPEFVPQNFPKDNFSVRWSGTLTPDHKCEFTLYSIADDGIKIYLDNTNIIDGWKPQPATEYSAARSLDNRPYQIKIEYFEEAGGEAVILGWECKHQNKALINQKFLRTENGKAGLVGEYFSNKDFKNASDISGFTRVDTAINWVTGGDGWGNRELQYYTKKEENVRTQNGHLVIEARKEFFNGSDYTSARIKTKQSWKYGRFEMRAKLPKGVGTWAAFWGLPTDWEYGQWPKSGEIDILEHVGHNEGHLVSSVHNIAHAGDLSRSDQQESTVLENVCTDFNNYILEWDENQISTFLNEKKIFTYPKNNQPWERWPFDKRFHLIINIAIGGNWGGQKGVDDNIFPTKMEIDYVRAYTKKDKN